MALVKPYSITPSGAQTSALLNQAMEDMFDNWSTLYTTASTLGSAVDLQTKRAGLQLAALQTTLGALYGWQLTTTTAQLYFDAHDLSYQGTPLVVGGATTAKLWPEYGLITPALAALPVNQFTLQDVNGVNWVPKSVQLQYSVGPTATIDPDTAGGWAAETDPTQLTNAFDGLGTTAWRIDLSQFSAAQDLHIWLKAVLPAEYLYQTVANAIVIHPEPMFGAMLQGVWYQGSTGGNTAVPAPSPNYFSTYGSGGGRPAMPELFLVPQTRIGWVKFHYVLPAGLGTAEERAFYLTQLGVYQCVFSATSQLTLDLSPIIAESSVQLTSTNNQVNPGAQQVGQPALLVDTTSNQASVTLQNPGTGGVTQAIRTLQVGTMPKS